MGEIVWEAEKDGLSVKIIRDEDAESPREWDNLGTIVGYPRKYQIYDEQAQNSQLYGSWSEWLQNELPHDVIALPVYMYDHGGITLSTTPFSCRWDSGQVGWIYVTKEKAREELGVQRITQRRANEIKEILKSEIHTMDLYVTGQVYGHRCEENGVEVESCWGYIGELNRVIEDVFNSIPEKFGILKDELNANVC